LLKDAFSSAEIIWGQMKWEEDH